MTTLSLVRMLSQFESVYTLTAQCSRHSTNPTQVYNIKLLATLFAQKSFIKKISKYIVLTF